MSGLALDQGTAECGVEHTEKQRYVIIGVFDSSKHKAAKAHARGKLCDLYIHASFQHVDFDTRACVPRVYQKNEFYTMEMRKSASVVVDSQMVKCIRTGDTY